MSEKERHSAGLYTTPSLLSGKSIRDNEESLDKSANDNPQQPVSPPDARYRIEKCGLVPVELDLEIWLLSTGRTQMIHTQVLYREKARWQVRHPPLHAAIWELFLLLE